MNNGAKPKVVMTRRIPEPGPSIIREHCMLTIRDEKTPPTHEELINLVEDADALLCLLTDKIDREVMDAGKNLKVISTYSVGVDHIDVKEATERGIYVCYTPGVLTQATAEFTWALLMAAARRVVEADKYVREGKWDIGWSPDLLLGQEIRGATLGIIGLGRIGQAVAKIAKGFDMKLIYYDVLRNTKAEQELGVEYRELKELLKEADFVTIHVPRTPETINLIGEEELKLMKPTAILVNTARGGIVNENALYKALRERWIFAAGLDVFEKEPTPKDNPLLTLPNVVVAPHIASATFHARSKMAEVAALNLVKVLKGEEPLFLFNPEVKSKRPLESVKMI
ncbi:MAG: D-glycerate dehydrogenase [Thermoproteota archaeon]